MLIMAGMVGTTMGAILYVVRSILVQEKGWGGSDLKAERRDAIVSVSMMFILSVAVMAAAAGTLHPVGLKVDNAIDMVKLMEPLAGRFAISVFVGGIVAAGLSSLFPIILLAPWLFADFNDKPRNMRSTSSRLLVLFGVLLGLVVPVFGGRPVMVMIMSQAMTVIVTPLVLALMLYIYNKKSVMGDNRLGVGPNISLVLVLLFTIAMAAAGIIGILGHFNS
jgi:Mn2+/Fe2+ NRAMP family transporter